MTTEAGRSQWWEAALFTEDYMFSDQTSASTDEGRSIVCWKK